MNLKEQLNALRLEPLPDRVYSDITFDDVVMQCKQVAYWHRATKSTIDGCITEDIVQKLQEEGLNCEYVTIFGSVLPNATVVSWK